MAFEEDVIAEHTIQKELRNISLAVLIFLYEKIALTIELNIEKQEFVTRRDHNISRSALRLCVTMRQRWSFHYPTIPHLF